MKFSTSCLPTILLLAQMSLTSSFTTVSTAFTSTQSNKIHHSLNTRSSTTPVYSSTMSQEATVDMNTYNLPLSSIMENWAATLQPQSATNEQAVILNTVNKELFVDSLTFDIQRTAASPSLGLILSELAGGREDGVGITIIEDTVPGGNADGIGFVAGDAITQIQVDDASFSSSVECADYDRTIAILSGLPPPPTEQTQIVSITVKRLRRRPKVRVTLQYPPSQVDAPPLGSQIIELYSGENLRKAMLTRGVKLNDALAKRFDSGGSGDCGGERTCATCVVGVVTGGELLNEMGVQEKTILKKKEGWRISCRAIVGSGMTEGELVLRVNPRQWED